MAAPYRDEEDLGIDIESRDNEVHIRHASESSENGYPIPIWMRESARSFKYRWIPLSLRKAGRSTQKWIRGPKPPIELRIRPLCPSIQEAPIRWINRVVPQKRYKVVLLMALYAIWFLVWSLMLKHNLSAGFIPGYGKPSNIWCGTSFW